MNNSWYNKIGWLYIPAGTRELLIVVPAVIYLITVFAALIQLYLVHGFLVEVDCKETFVNILF